MLTPLVAVAGDLNPPPGPVMATMKTLTEVEPRTPVQSLSGSAIAQYVITQPGSYYLTGHVTGVDGKNGIQIRSSLVTLDLNGFALVGVSNALSGIFVDGADDVSGIVVQNGLIRTWPQGGVHATLSQNAGEGYGRFDRLEVVNNGSAGIFTDGEALMTNCIATWNQDIGLNAAGDSSVVRDCVARRNGNVGIAVGTAGTIDHCVALKNNGDGLRVTFSLNSTVQHCISRGNTGRGINVGLGGLGDNSVIEDNIVVSNSTGGIVVYGVGNIILKNTARSNDGVGNYSIAVGNTVGPIVNVAGVGDISATAGADHPWANFSF